MSCKRLNWEYPNNSQGKPENIKERKYSRATHSNGIMTRHQTGFFPSLDKAAANDPTNSARNAAKSSKIDILKYAGKYP